GDGLDPAHARRDAALRHDLEETDIARAANVRAAAELGREVAEPEHAHPVAVLVAEERERAGRDRLVVRHLADLGVDVAADLVVDELLDRRELLRLDRLVVREVEAQPIGRDERPLLLHVLAEHAAERGMKQVRRRVVETNRLAPLAVDLRMEPGPDLERAAGNLADVAVCGAELLRVIDAELARVARERAGVADLP